MASENGEQQEAEAFLQSEGLRAATEATETMNDESPNNNNNSPAPNGSFSIRINIGNRSNRDTTVRRRRAIPDNTPTNNNSTPTSAPVHARTIDRFPGGQNTETTMPQPASLGTIRQRANVNGVWRRPVMRPMPTTGIRVTPPGRNTQVRIVTGDTGRVQQQPHRVQVSPLVPTPLPFHASSYNNTENESSSEQHDEDRNEFKCLICFGMSCTEYSFIMYILLGSMKRRLAHHPPSSNTLFAF